MKLTEQLKKPTWIAAIFAFVTGIAVHLFGLVNILHNHDNITRSWGYGDGISSGRWFLHLVGEAVSAIGGNVNLPLVCGVIFIAFLALSAALFVSVIGIKGRKSAAIIGAVFVTFPAVTSTMFYRYTAGYYGLAIFLSVLAVWVIDKNKFGFIISGVFTALALGIYQAYLPLTVAMLVLVMIKRVLTEDESFLKHLLRGIRYCASVVIGLVLYFVIMRLSLAVMGIELTGYQGIGTMGKLSISQIPSLVITAFKSFILMPFENYCSLSSINAIKYSYIFLGLVTVATVIYVLIIKKKKLTDVIMTVFLGVMFPIAVNLIVIMCPDSVIYTLMVYSFAVVLCTPIVLVETCPAGSIRKYTSAGAMALVLCLVMSYSYLANVNYSSMYYANRQTENYLNGLITQIRSTEGFTADKKWVLVGDYINDPLFYDPWQSVDIFGGSAHTYGTINGYSRNWWIESYTGITPPWADGNTTKKIENSDEVADMPTWPDSGSIQIIDDVVVIKIS